MQNEVKSIMKTKDKKLKKIWKKAKSGKSLTFAEMEYLQRLGYADYS